MSALKDLTGKRFGRLTVVSLHPKRDKFNRARWMCKCDCGNETVVRSSYLINGDTKSCGCIVHEIKDIAGQRFGRLIAVEPTDEKEGGATIWKCQCDCGKTTKVPVSKLINGTIQSCGCSRINDLSGKRFGRLLVVKLLPERKGGKLIWQCICDCGNTANVMGTNLVRGTTGSCGCLGREAARERGLLRIGKLNTNWNPLLTNVDRDRHRDYPEYKEWREAVFERDCYTCQKCGNVGGEINAHHIDSYANNKDKRTSIDNGITLCKKCHNNFHHKYGWQNNNKEQLLEWLNEK